MNLKRAKNKYSGFFSRLNSLIISALGEPYIPERLMVLDELIFTILSQNTNDNNRDRAWNNLKENFPSAPTKLDIQKNDMPNIDISEGNCSHKSTSNNDDSNNIDNFNFRHKLNNYSASNNHKVNWAKVHSLGLELEPYIKCAGLAPAKTQTIMRVLQLSLDKYRKYNLEELSDLNSEKVLEFLISIKGVGPKTANCVICFSLNKPAFPVDVHVLRIMQRLRVVPEKTSMSEANIKLTDLVPPYLHKMLHLGIIQVGKKFCRPSNPNCQECPLLTMPCAYYEKNNGKKRKKSQL